jgi:hypothetical protein
LPGDPTCSKTMNFARHQAGPSTKWDKAQPRRSTIRPKFLVVYEFISLLLTNTSDWQTVFNKSVHEHVYALQVPHPYSPNTHSEPPVEAQVTWSTTTNAPGGMDGWWTGDIISLYFSSLVNHSGYLSCCFYYPTTNNPLALTFVLTGVFRLYVFFQDMNMHNPKPIWH